MSQEDEEANYFAMCVLMPEDMIKADIAKSGKLAFDIIDEPLFQELADRYGVTVQMIILRLNSLGYMNN